MLQNHCDVTAPRNTDNDAVTTTAQNLIEVSTDGTGKCSGNQCRHEDLSSVPSYLSTRLLSTRLIPVSCGSIACSKLVEDNDSAFSPTPWITQQSDLFPPVNAKARDLDIQISDAFLAGEEVFVSNDNRKEHSFAQISETWCDSDCVLTWKEFQEKDLQLTVDPKYEPFLSGVQRPMGQNASFPFLLDGLSEAALSVTQCVCGNSLEFKSTESLAMPCGCFCQSASRLVEILKMQTSSSKLLETSAAATDLDDENTSSFNYQQGNTYNTQNEFPSVHTFDCAAYQNCSNSGHEQKSLVYSPRLGMSRSLLTQKMEYPYHPNISTETRQSVISWMWKVVQSMHWSPATFFIAVHAMDVYLLSARRNPLDESEVPLISTACLFLGVSTEEEHIQAQKSKHFIGQVPNVISVRQIFNQQLEILATLPKELLSTKTPQDVCLHYLARMRSSAVLTARSMKRSALGVSTLSTASSSSSKKLQLVLADSIVRFYNFAISTLISRSLPELLPSPSNSAQQPQHSIIELIVDTVIFLLVKCFERGIYAFVPISRLTAAMCLTVFVTLTERLTKDSDLPNLAQNEPGKNSVVEPPLICHDHISICQFCSMVFELDYECQLQPIVSQLSYFFNAVIIDGVPSGLQPLLCYLRLIEFPKPSLTPRSTTSSRPQNTPRTSLSHSGRRHSHGRQSIPDDEMTRLRL